MPIAQQPLITRPSNPGVGLLQSKTIQYKPMRRVIFYSWQSDLPNSTNRSLIQQALENIGKAITADKTIDIDPVIDRDTQGIAGAPDIAKAIFGKIGAADVFVADVS